MTIKEWLNGKIFSKYQYIYCKKPNHGDQVIANVRGTGCLSRITSNYIELQDELGVFIAEAIQEKLDRMECNKSLSNEERNSYDIECYSDMVDWLKEVREKVSTDKSDEWVKGFNYALLLLTESRRLDRSMPNADDPLTPEWLQENGKRWGFFLDESFKDDWYFYKASDITFGIVVGTNEGCFYMDSIAEVDKIFDGQFTVKKHITIHQFKCLMGLLGIKEVEASNT